MLVISSTYAQDTVLVTQKLPNKLTEFFYALKSNPDIKQGLYQVRYKNIAIVSGLYTNNKRSGIWHFFNRQGQILQNYNYDKNELLNETREQPGDGFKYIFDKDFTRDDIVTKPVKIGGRYYGYLPYLNIFKMPKDLNVNHEAINAYIELLISPGGRLADYTIHLSSSWYDFDRTLNVNLDLLNDADKQFIPATINKEAVACRIIVQCNVDGSNKLVF